MIDFLGSAIVPKSVMRQSFLTMLLSKAELFTLNWRQSFLAIRAKVYDELQKARAVAKRTATGYWQVFLSRAMQSIPGRADE
jgi:hypothetical protein